MNKLRLIITLNSILLCLWLLASYFNDAPVIPDSKELTVAEQVK